MSKKIYISPSSQPANTYAVGNTNEQEQCRKIGAALEKELNRRGFTAKAGLSGTMYTRVKASNDMGADLHLPIHTNGFDGKVAGLRIMISKRGGEAEQIAKAIMNRLAPITPGKSDGISTPSGIYEINSSKAICVYIEVGFHDNPEEAKWIIEHTNEIAIAIADGLCDHYNVEHKETEKPVEKPAATPVKPTPAPVEKSIDELAREVIAGKHGSGDARKKSLGNKYAEVQKRVNEILSGKVTTSTPVATPTKRVHTVVKNDTLWGLANKYLGNGSRYPEIVKLNGLKTTMLRVGQKLTIPEK